MSLTHGAVSTLIQSGGQSDQNYQPIVQIINVKGVQSGGTTDRYRVVLSDGEHYAQGMLATQLNDLVTSGQIKENVCVEIQDSMSNIVQNRSVIIVLKLKVINAAVPNRIGTPVDLEKSGVSAAAAAAPAGPMYNRTNLSGGANPYGGAGGATTAAAPKSDSPSNPYGQASAGSGNNNNFGGGGGGGPSIARAAAAPSGAYTPISQLNMYQNRWTIRARVTSKSDIRTWSNARGEGSLFSIELLDNSGVDIRATMFKEAVDKFYNMLEVGKVYTFSGGRLKVANMQYNTCKSQFEATFDHNNSEIHLDNDTGDIQQNIFEFIKIADLEATEEGKNVDILAVVKAVGEPASLVSKKTGKDLTKCDLTLVDDSGVEISLTVWGNRAMQAPTEYANQPIVAFRHARVSDFGGKSLSAGDTIVPNPQVPEAQALSTWWQSGGGQAASRSLSSSGGGGGKMAAFSERKNIAAIKNEHLGSHSDKPDWIAFRGTFSFIKKDKEGGAWYPACANAGEPCKNRFKVTQTTDGKWFCDKCQGTFDNCVRRWIFSATVADSTSTTWVSLFNEQAETLFDGVTADEVYNKCMEEGGLNQDLYDGYFAKANYSEWIFKCKVKNELVGEEARVKTSVYSMHPLDYAKESLELLDALKAM